MKRSKIQLEAITDIENCKRAILNASRGKRKRNKVMFYIENIEGYAKVLSEYLSNPNSVFRDGSKAVKVEGTKRRNANCGNHISSQNIAHIGLLCKLLCPI